MVAAIARFCHFSVNGIVLGSVSNGGVVRVENSVNIGDRVKITPRRKERLSGRIGTIMEMTDSSAPKAMLYRVQPDGDDKLYSFWEHELTDES